MKSTNQITSEIISSKNAKTIAGQFYSFDCNCSNETPSSDTLLELVVNNSSDFTADIAKKALNSMNDGFDLRLSSKQSWCIAYQIMNNIEVYKLAIADYIVECEKLNN